MNLIDTLSFHTIRSAESKRKTGVVKLQGGWAASAAVCCFCNVDHSETTRAWFASCLWFGWPPWNLSFPASRGCFGVTENVHLHENAKSRMRRKRNRKAKQKRRAFFWGCWLFNILALKSLFSQLSNPRRFVDLLSARALIIWKIPVHLSNSAVFFVGFTS